MKLGTLREFLTHFPANLEVILKVMDEDIVELYEIDHVGVAIIDGKVEIYGVKSSRQV